MAKKSAAKEKTLKTKKIKNKKIKKAEIVEEEPESQSSSEDEAEIEDEIEANDQVIESVEEQLQENDSEDEISENEEKNPKKEKKNPESKKIIYDKEDENKTIFCGNVPNEPNITKGRVKDLFSQYGTIKSIRLRTENGNVIFSKKVKKYCKSFNAYIVFEKEEDAKKSLELNGSKLLENHLRVNMANNKQSFTNKGTIFVGNLPFEAQEAEIHEFFSQVGEIEYVRKLPKKGIAFICFKKGVGLADALKLNDQDFQGRKLRVSRSESKDKQERKRLFKKDPKTGRVMKQKVKKSHKINDKFLKGKQNVNNPIVKKIRETQKAKYNKFTDTPVSKKELFRPGGKIDKETQQINREKFNKRQTFSGSKVNDLNDKSKIKKGKVSKTAKHQKVIAKKLKSAAMRVKAE